MAKTTVYLTKEEQQVIDAVKIKYGIKDNNQALTIILEWFKEYELEHPLRPELVAETEKTRKDDKFVKTREFSKDFNSE